MSRIEGGGGGESEKEEVNNKEEIETTDHLFCMFCKQNRYPKVTEIFLYVQCDKKLFMI